MQIQKACLPAGRGFSPILAVVIIGLVLLGAVGLIVYLQETEPTQPDPTPSNQTTNPSTQNPDPTADWQTYKNEEYGFEIKYPKESSFAGEIKPNVDLWQNTLVYQDKSFLTISITTVGNEEFSEIDYKQVSGDINIGGIEGKIVESTGPSKECTTSIIEKNGLAYIFDDNCWEDKTLFNEMLSTFRFIEQN